MLDHNCDIVCEQATTEGGRLKYEVNYSEVTKSWFPKLISTDREKQYIPEILNRFWNFFSYYKHTQMEEVPENSSWKHSYNPLKEKPGNELIIKRFYKIIQIHLKLF